MSRLKNLGILKVLTAVGMLMAVSFLGHSAAHAQPACQQIAPVPGIIYGQPSTTCYAADVDSTHALKVTGSFTPSPSATVGWSTQSCTVACASTLVSGAHSLGNVSFSATVTGWLLVYDATSCAANGTVTPLKAFAYTVANSTIGVSWADTPIVNATGIAACFSSTGPYTATASTTAFISVDYK